MSWLSRSFKTSIGQKLVMTITGLLLFFFLFVHLAGNFTIWGGEAFFTRYVSTLESLGNFTHFIEVGLALLFIVHIFFGLRLALQNAEKRPIQYKVYESNNLIDFSARYTWQTGVLILVFLVVHLITFWYLYKFGGEGRELFEIVTTWFANPLYSLFYIIIMIALGIHLQHGFQSAFQTLGWTHPKFTPIIEKLGTFIAWLFGLGFSLIPIYFYFSAIGGN